ncbi:NAD(P)H-dependent flavin oxidoreductase [Celerinatantimonas diazotrophica]|uniref:Nitronate monooxygenase n=1 Tax=Celerinatantimonas diazotrophica TaxID=412034 RepID=A0A4R1K3U4_9GAMM|nr:nitronate monooxygenase [Celerinatantimonas diazotrophica]TCK58768.1 nitronate monooxygenase [Celerinatantimonas diazotrophica]CAG9297399.1 Nitronate monooxygenase [Celerinatantimonas diazotrophica]
MNINYKDLLGTDLPIIQAPMAGVQGSSLAIAVSQAGGLGSLPCGMLSTDKIVSEIALIKASTRQPFNLNFFCHELRPYDAKRQKIWRSKLKPYFTELGLDMDVATGGASRVPFSHDIADAIEPFAPEFISFHFGLPDKDLLQRVMGWGTTVISSATTVEEAIWLESRGVHGIIAQGLEAGGHRGMFLSSNLSTQMGLISLVSQVVKRVNIPVIAAGGISDNNTVKACMQLGATAVQIGTAYLLCSEAQTSPIHRQALKSEKSLHTAVTNIFSGKPARGIVNRVMDELGYMSEFVPEYPYASIEMAQLRQGAEKQGIDDFSSLWCGQNTQGCQEISAKELTRQLAGKC